jgi:AcrR family transcriptional regulator
MVLPLRERRRLLLREEILQATRALAAEKGYAAMSMDELAARVGISKPTLYSYFDTKEDLIAAAAIHSMQQVMDIIEAELAGQTPLQRLSLILRTTLQILMDDGITPMRPMSPELMQLIRSREDTTAYIRRIDAALLALIQQGIQQGEIDPALEASAIMLSFHALIHTLKVECLINTELCSPVSMIDTLVTLFERGLRNPALSAPSAERGAEHGSS